MSVLTALLKWLAPGAASPAQSITAAQVGAGVTALEGAWPALKACIADHFRNLGEDATMVEDLAEDLAQIFPPAIYVADAAELVAFLVSLGVVTTAPPSNPPVDGINPASGAPLFT